MRTFRLHPAIWLSLLLTVLVAGLTLFRLGSTTVPRTWYEPRQAGETFLIDLGSERTPDRLYLYTGIGEGEYRVEISAEGMLWRPLCQAKRLGPFIWSWSVIRIPAPESGALSGRWLRFTVEKPGEMLFELALTEAGSTAPLPGLRALPASALPGAAPAGFPTADVAALAHLTDESAAFTYYPDPTVDMVFDEVYHARTAWEHLTGREPYEWTHPPLGKLIIATGVAVFGMDPFGWRLPGAIAGILMLPLFFAVANALFGKPWWALAAQAFLAFDFMRFTQSRIGTVDVFMVCFTLVMFGGFWRWWQTMEAAGRPAADAAATAPGSAGLTSDLRAAGWLVLGGLGLALGASTKWNALYAAAGLAVLFWVALLRRWRREGAAFQAASRPSVKSNPKAAALAARSAKDAPAAAPEVARPRRGRWMALQVGAALAGFVALPLVVYCLCYLPYLGLPGHAGGLAEIWDWQKKMYAYHSELNVPHDFASAWWQWPLLVKPVWYYTARDTMPEGITATVAAFGNPAVWWATVIALPLGLWRAIQRRDQVLMFVLVCFAALYLPWAVAPRKVTFIYHFFPMVPVLCLLIARLWQGFREDRQALGKPVRALDRGLAVHIGLAAVLFALFFPVISGLTVPVAYVNFLRWIPGWWF